MTRKPKIVAVLLSNLKSKSNKRAKLNESVDEQFIDKGTQTEINP
jgi:hypothetical protein